MHAQDERRPVADRRGVVGGAGPVRRADLAQHGARLRHHVGHAEAAADLHQLAARDDHLPAGRQRRQDEQRRRRVVDDDGRLGAGEAADGALGVDVAAPAMPPARGRIRGSCNRRRARATRSTAARASGARPRFVWTITPVALMTRTSDGADRPRGALRAALDELGDVAGRARRRGCRGWPPPRRGSRRSAAWPAALRADGTPAAGGAARSTGSPEAVFWTPTMPRNLDLRRARPCKRQADVEESTELAQHSERSCERGGALERTSWPWGRACRTRLE